MGGELLTATTITAAATIVGALIGRSDIWDRLFTKQRFPSLAGTRWMSKWKDTANPDEVREELFEFSKQKRGRVSGQITMNDEPNLKWSIEGDYNDRFLRLFWQPANDAKNKFFMDYGCYFFERKGPGHFEGIAIGFDWQTDTLQTTFHELRQLPN